MRLFDFVPCLVLCLLLSLSNLVLDEVELIFVLSSHPLKPDERRINASHLTKRKYS